MNTFLPSVYGNAIITGEGNEYGLTARAYQFAMAWLSLLPIERRSMMRCDSRLVEAAQKHAEYLDRRQGDELLQSMHRGEGGSYSNQRVIEAGYKLPKGYSPFANNVESCARDHRDPATVAISLAGHEPHRSHMLGLPGFEDRVVWGVGNAANDYVFIAAPEKPA